MAVNANDRAAQNYENSTDGQTWLAGAQGADLDGDDWTSGLADAGVENAGQLNGDTIWASEYSVTDDDASEYNTNTTAEAWASGWGDASNWNV